MAELEGIGIEDFRVLVERAGLSLTVEELETLKPMYDFYAERTGVLHNLDLEATDLAVTFSSNWDPQE